MFILLKVLLFFLRPLVWIVTLLLIGWITKSKRKPQFIKAGIFLLLFFSNPFIIGRLIRWYETPATPIEQTGLYPAGIVLGGFVSYNLKDDQGYFNPASDRFIQTALLYKTGHIQKIIVAAGNGYIVKHNFREADFIKAHLITLGIPADAIYTDPFSRNTEENALNSKKIIDSLKISTPSLLISSAMHLPRAQLAFRKAGVTVVPYACDLSSKNVGNNFFQDYLLPSARALDDWDNLIKEIAGTIVYRLKAK
ncbi:MAG TPA: YdcF family protein [Flavisolibacter sp.]|jgi:uncharacterized SAM-binding protein YcdF (DUF218 family)|nr:YdcF family protein [Flavisolibacter sp.]